MQLHRRFDLARGRSLTLGTLAERVAAVHGRRRAVAEADSGFTASFAEAAELVDRWAGAIAERAEPGDRVVLALPNGYHLFLATLAASRAGCLPAPVNAQMTQLEVEHVIADCGASLVIRSVDELAGAEGLGRAIPADPRDVAALLYTSGTTGSPKGAELTHRGLLGGMALTALAPMNLRHDEIVVGLPVAHIFGFAVMVGAACAGVPVYYLPKFNPVRCLDALEERHCSVFAGVPAMYRMLLAAGAEERDLRSVRLWISGADVMPADLADRFKRMGATAHLPVIGAVGEAVFAEGYGLVETSGGVAVRVSPPLLSGSIGGSVGLPLPGYHLRVVDEAGSQVPVGAVGELLVSGPGVLRGYYGASAASDAAFTADGWLRTGDLARRGVLGAVNFEGRRKDVIKRGGYSVYATEVERVLEAHPDVLEVAVVPIPDERDGQVPAAAVRLRPRATLARADLPGWCAERLAAYKVPERFVVVKEFPRTGTDKIQRRLVAEQLAARPTAPRR